MKKISLFCMYLIFLWGCSKIQGPISGEEYTHIPSPFSNACKKSVNSNCYECYRELISEHKAPFKEECQELYVKQHPDEDERFKKAVLESELEQGMTTEQVLFSWGKPEQIDKSSEPGGNYEHWEYVILAPTGRIRDRLHFKDGILESWNRNELDRDDY